MNRLGPLLLTSALAGCAPTVPAVHARAVASHLAGLQSVSQRVADDAPHHARCAEGPSPVSERAQELHHDLSALADQAEGRRDGDWPDRDSFQSALSEASELQTKLALLHAEYDACRALSPEAVVATEGTLGRPGIRRLAALQIEDLGTGLDAEERLTLDRHLRARLGPVFALIPREAVVEAQRARRTKAGCEAACALAVARDVGAHKVLALRLTRVDERCSVVLDLYDLSTGMAERARTVRQDCGLPALMAGVEDAIGPLVEPR